MKIHYLDQQPSILHQFLHEIRDKNDQKNAALFRRNLERIGEIMAYEVSKSLKYKTRETTTVLGQKQNQAFVEQPVIVSILRAGLALHQGVLNYFDQAENGFISANRITNGQKIDIELSYQSLPDINQKTILLADPMLATGHSMVACLKELVTGHTPTHFHILVVVAAPEGITYLQEQLNDLPITLWVASRDEKLNQNAYIVPGLGDAGDLAYGKKL